MSSRSYEMRVRVAAVRGPLADIEVSFHNHEGDLCFQVGAPHGAARELFPSLLPLREGDLVPDARA